MLQQLLSKDFNLLFALLQRETTAYFKDNRWLYDFFLQLLQDFNVPQKHKDYLYAQLAAVDELNQYTPVDKDNTGIHISLSFGGTLHEHIKRISSDAVLPPNLAFMVGSYYYQNSLSQPDAFKRLMQKKALHFLTPLKTNNTCAYYMIWSMLDNKETLNNMTPTSEKFSALTLKHNEETITKWFKLITRMIKEFNKPRFSYAGQQPCDSHPYNHWLLNEIPVLQKLIILYALFKDPTKTLLSYQIAVPILYNDMNNWKKQSKQLILDRIHMLTTIEPAQLDAQVKEIHQLASKRASIETVSDLVFKQPKLSKQSAP